MKDWMLDEVLAWWLEECRKFALTLRAADRRVLEKADQIRNAIKELKK